MEQTEKKTALDLVNERTFAKETLNELEYIIGTNALEFEATFVRTLSDACAVMKSHIEMINEELSRR